jgi:hypothetical protein
MSGMIPRSMDLTDQHELWEAMADLFLDTETRYRIPEIAGRCVRNGLTRQKARNIWRYEVTPAVWHNLIDVAGEWAGWPTDWLIARIEEVRRKAESPPGWSDALRYHATAGAIDPVWRAVEQCIDAFAQLQAPEAARLEASLTWLARVFFDFVPGARPADPTLETVYRATFLPIFAPLAVTCQITGESPAACRERVQAALLADPHGRNL